VDMNPFVYTVLTFKIKGKKVFLFCIKLILLCIEKLTINFHYSNLFLDYDVCV
jgi:hypothetical protein